MRLNRPEVFWDHAEELRSAVREAVCTMRDWNLGNGWRQEVYLYADGRVESSSVMSQTSFADHDEEPIATLHVRAWWMEDHEVGTENPETGEIVYTEEEIIACIDHETDAVWGGVRRHSIAHRAFMALLNGKRGLNPSCAALYALHDALTNVTHFLVRKAFMLFVFNFKPQDGTRTRTDMIPLFCLLKLLRGYWVLQLDGLALVSASSTLKGDGSCPFCPQVWNIKKAPLWALNVLLQLHLILRLHRRNQRYPLSIRNKGTIPY